MVYRILFSIGLLICFSCNTKHKTTAFNLPEIHKDRAIYTYNFEEFENAFLRAEEGKIRVINFWATWCRPCVKELPYFEELAEKHKEIEVVLVSLDLSTQKESNLLPFVRENNLKSEVIHLDEPDANAWIPKVDENWSGAIPATIIINKSTKMFYEQSFNYAQLFEAVNIFKNEK